MVKTRKKKNMEKFKPVDAVIGEYKDYFHISLTWVFKSWVPHWLKEFVATQHILQKDGKTERWGLYE